MLLFLVLASLPLRAQVDTGAVVGTVSDSMGAVIAGATITVINQSTDVILRTTSNRQGQYQVLALIPGNYTVESTANGFSSVAVKNIRINVQSRVAVNFTLKVGMVTEKVTVSGLATNLQTQSANLGAVIGTRAINDLPLNGRNFAQLALLSPGVGKNYSGSNQVADGFNVNGMFQLQNNMMLDGMDNNTGSANLIEGATESVKPPPDALSEFRMQTRTYSAEFGNMVGGILNASLKSGTNHFHGDVWEFIRNDALDANDFFDNRYGNRKGPLKQNQYGGTIGGPILHNHTFFFADYQQVLIHTKSTQYSTVPTPLMKGESTQEPGVFDFKELNSIPLEAIVPSQSGCIQGSIILSSCIDPVGRKLLQAYPNPNIPSQVAKEGIPGSFGQTNYEYIVSVPNNTWSTDARVDETINDANRIYGSFSYYHSTGVDPQWTSDPIIGSSNFAATTQTHGINSVLSYLYTPSSNMLNVARVGFSRSLGANQPPSGLALGKSAAPQFGLTGVPVNDYTYGLPQIGVNGLQTLGDSTYRPQHYISQVYQAKDDFTWLYNRHSMKFGLALQRYTSDFLDLANTQGGMGASGQYSSNDRFGATDLLLGDMSSASYESITVPHTFQTGYSIYGQDTWRATNRLVINYGVRYELFSPLLERNNRVANFSPANGGSLITAAPNASGWYARSLIHPDKLDFAPRVGFAYQPGANIVFRGGYGIFYQHRNRFGSESVMTLNPPFLTQASINQPNGSSTPAFQLQDGFPASSLVSIAGSTPPLYELQIRAQDPHQRTSYAEQASFGYEIQLAKQTTLSMDYVGNFGRRMGRIVNANQGVPEWNAQNQFLGSYFQYQNLINWHGVGPQNPHFYTTSAFLEYLENNGYLNYNGLQTQIKHDFSRGLFFNASYTWSHDISDFNVPINGNYIGENAYRDPNHEKSDSPMDVRNRFVASGIWNVPMGRGQRYLNHTPVLSEVIGGWQLNGIFTVQGGNPFTIYGDQADQSGSHDGYADCIGNPFQGATRNASKFIVGGGGFYINPAAYGNPPDDSSLGPAYRYGHFGTCHPYSVHGPGYRDTDLSLFRNFPIHGRVHGSFRAEAFNVWNNVNWGTPYGYIGNLTAFGTVSGTIGSPRNLQFALKIFY